MFSWPTVSFGKESELLLETCWEDELMLNIVPLKGGGTKTRDLRHVLENKSALKWVWRRIAEEACMSGMKLYVYVQKFPEILIRARE